METSFIKLTYKDEEKFEVYGHRKFYISMGFKNKLLRLIIMMRDLIIFSKQLVAEEAPEQILPSAKDRVCGCFEIPGTDGPIALTGK